MKSDFMIIGGRMSANVRVSRIQKRGQITIPAEIRQKLHLEEGDLVAFIETAEGIVLSPQEVVPASTRSKVDSRSQQKLGDTPSPAAPEGPSIVEQTAGIFRRRQDDQSGAIDFEQARQAFIEYLARHAGGEVDGETEDSQT
jgi:AbrB family looped-hinge helix DNA binding protein